MSKPSSSSFSSSSCCKTISIRVEFLIIILLLVTMSILLEYPMKPSLFKPDNKNCPKPTLPDKSTENNNNKDKDETKSPNSIAPSSISNNNEDCDCRKKCKQQMLSSQNDENNNKNSKDGEDNPETTTTITQEPKTKSSSNNNNNQKDTNSPGSLNLVALFDTEKEANSLLFQRNDNKDPASFSSLEQLKLDAISQLKDFFPPSFLNNNNDNSNDGDKFLQLFIQLSEYSAQDHRRYSKLTRALKTITTLSRMSFVKEASNFIAKIEETGSTNAKSSDDESSTANQNNSKNKSKPTTIQLFRFHSSSAVEDDNALTVPSIPTNLPNLEIVAPTNFGLVAGFSRPQEISRNKNNKKKKERTIINQDGSASASDSNQQQQQGASSSPLSQPATLKVATVLTGHMRSYRRCAERLTKMVLGPTGSSLFIATYQDRGEKRYGKREQVSNDDVMDWVEVEKVYSPHLKGLFVGDVPLLRRRLEVAFPKAFTNTQFSWMLYQFLLIEIGLNMTEAAWRGWDFSADAVGEMAFGSVSSTASVRNNFHSMKSSLIASEVLMSSANHNNNNNKDNGKNSFSMMTRNDVASGVWPWLHFWRNCGKQDSKDGECSLVRILQKSQKNNQPLQQRNRPYDIFIRLRPDLFIIGTIKLSTIRLFDDVTNNKLIITKIAKSDEDQTSPAPPSLSPSVKNENENSNGDELSSLPSSALNGEFQLSLDCGEEARTARNYPNRNFLAEMDDNVILVTPHHPVYEWILDKVSDLSQVATYTAAKKFLPMHRFLSQLNQQQQDSVFVPQCTAERLWNSRAKFLKMHQNKTFGWFAMLRNASTFRMGANEGASSERRRQLVRKIFAITNPDDIACPMEGGVMVTMPPHSPGMKNSAKKKK